MSLIRKNKWLDNQGEKFSKQQEMDYTYTNIDKLIRLSFGENAHLDNAMFHNGDYSVSIEKAQEQKCAFVCEQLGITKNSKVLDMGCGWGGLLKYIQKLGAKGIGVTLSAAQIEACKRNGLEVYLKDMRDITKDDFGIFDAVTAIGSLEHVASLEDHFKGTQDQAYQNFFKQVASLLPFGGKFYVQSIVFGKNMIPFEKVDVEAPKNSMAYMAALVLKRHSNSWLPTSGEHVIQCASPYFKSIHHSNGRLDFIETNRKWNKRSMQFGIRKYLWFLSFVPKFIMNKEFRHQLNILRLNPMRACFESEILDHSRFVFEKI